MTKLIHAADVSMYSGLITVPQWQNAKAKGIDLAIVGSWHGRSGNQNAQATLSAARMAGMKTATYTVLNGLSGDEAVKRAMDACGTEWGHCRFCALDIEIDGFADGIMMQALYELSEMAMLTCIYTRADFWEHHLHPGATWGADKNIPLWDANYNRSPNLILPHYYGGWRFAVGHQFQGSNNRLGFNADLNVFSASWVESGAQS